MFEHTSVSSVLKLFRSQEYLWIPFDIFAYTVVWGEHIHTHAQEHTLFVFTSSVKMEDDGFSFVMD